MAGRLATELQVALQSVRLAASATQLAAQQMLAKQSVVKKAADSSPVTVADWSAQAIVSWMLERHFPEDTLVAEEESEQLRSNTDLLKQAMGICQQVLPSDAALSEQRLLDLIGRGSVTTSNGKVKAGRRYWTLDPVDGTKGFIRREQYAVCLALIDGDGQVDLAALACPNLPATAVDNETEKSAGVLYYAVRGEGAFQQSLLSSEANQDIQSVRSNVNLKSPAQARFCESVESGHSSHSAASEIASRLSISAQPIRMDSQCKYGLVASGQADIYMRLPVRKDYQENIWDHAAGDLIVREAGGCVTDIDGRRLDFSSGGPKLTANRGVVASCNAEIHSTVLLAIKQLQL